MMHDNDDLVRKIREVLDESLGDIDTRTMARLKQARQGALTRRNQRPIYYPWLRWGLVPATILVMILVMNPWEIEQPESQIDVADLALFSEADNIDFFAEELEFYQWLLEIDENEKKDHSLHRPDVSDGRGPSLVCGTGGSIAGAGTNRVSGLVQRQRRCVA
jgi:hypothetical protein